MIPKLEPDLGQLIADLYNDRFCARLMIQRALNQNDTACAHRWVKKMVEAARLLRELGIPVLCVYADEADNAGPDEGDNCDDGQGPRQDYSTGGGECEWE